MTKPYINMTEKTAVFERNLRIVTEAEAITDLKHGRRQGMIAWAVVHTLLSSRRPLSELVAMNCGDLQSANFPPELVEHLAGFLKWKKIRGESTARKVPLFCSQRNRRFSARGIRDLWRACVKRAGLPASFSITSKPKAREITLDDMREALTRLYD